MYKVISVSIVLFLGGGGLVGADELVYSLSSPFEQIYGGFGFCVSGIGDVTGDGNMDILVGADSENNGGRVYVFNGATGDTIRTLTSPNQIMNGGFGYSISGGGDIDEDGYPEIIVGAPGEFSYAGQAYVFSGQSGEIIYSLNPPFPQDGAQFGHAVSDAGDVNGDGISDIVAGSYLADSGGLIDAGRAYVFSGATGNILYELISPIDQADGWFGVAVSGIGDLNGDGFDEVVIGADREDFDPSSNLMAGRAYVYNGATGRVLYAFASPNEGNSGGRFGNEVAGAGDVNGDGRPDILVGGASEHPQGSMVYNVGRAYLYDGATGSLLHILSSPQEEQWGYFGISLARAGDADGDGYSDVIIGAYRENPGESPDEAGRAHVFRGLTGEHLVTLVSPSEDVAGRFGTSVSGLGDIDGDGKPEVIVGAPNEAPGESPNRAGRAHVYRMAGGAAEPATPGTQYYLLIEGPAPNPTTGPFQYTVRVPNSGVNNVYVALFDSQGRQITDFPNAVIDVSNPASLHRQVATGIPAGLYWLRFKSGGHQICRPLILNR